MEVATGDCGLRRGADAAIAIGLVGATVSAVTGLNDWQHTNGEARRVGTVHGLLNVGATSLYLTSWLLRKQRGRRGTARALGLLGFATTVASAYLGGHLVYQQRIGVNHAPQSDLPTEFVPVIAEADLPENTLHRAEADGVPVVLLRRGNEILALAETCAHMGGPLSEGKIEDGDCVRCPWHGSKFSLEDGSVIEGPSAFDEPAFETRIRDGQVEVRVKIPGMRRRIREPERAMQPVS
jgi:nitrite reductase/ring-hydroxylating ferredoxin subunit